MKQASRKPLAVLLLVAMTGLGCVRVDSGHAGVKWTWTGGTQQEVFGEGVHIMPPWNRMYIYITRTLDQVENLHILTSNGLSVGMETSIRYRVIASELPKLHQELGMDYYPKIIQPVVRSEAREVVARYTPEEIYSTKRQEIGDGIEKAVQGALEGKHVLLEAILIRNVDLPDKIREAISEKLEEEQKAQKMKFTLDRERKEAERKRIEAQGIADFQKIVSAGISEALLKWKGIEATQALAQSTNAKVVVIGSGEEGLPIILGGAN
jgi:regulator of protease activity HflC (stomatin/prohibitin superfamily)